MELRNIFELILPFCHVPSELPGEPETPMWGANASGTSDLPSSSSHQPFSFWVALSAGLGPGYTVGESKLTQTFLTVQRF